MRNRKLKITLLANAIFSIFTGIGMTIFKDAIAQLMLISESFILLLIGIGLILFSSFLFWTAFKKAVHPKHIHFIILQDWLWVLASVMIVVIQAFDLSTIAYFIIGIIAFIVAGFAILQNRFLTKNDLYFKP